MKEVIPNGITVSRIICRRLSKSFVPVMSAISMALVDSGEHRSPTKIPDKIAPPVIHGLMPMVLAMVMQTTPIVAEVPKVLDVVSVLVGINLVVSVVAVGAQTSVVGLTAEFHKLG